MTFRTSVVAISVVALALALVSLLRHDAAADPLSPQGFIENRTDGSIQGRVELVPGFPAAGCRVTFPESGAFVGFETTCDDHGYFVARKVPYSFTQVAFDLSGVPGVGRLTVPVILHGGVPYVSVTIPPQPRSNVPLAVPTALGVVTLSVTGAVTGRVSADDGEDLTAIVISVPAQGIATSPGPNGVYLLRGVAPGTRDILAQSPSGRTARAKPIVNPGATTFGVDLVVALPTRTGLPPPGSGRGGLTRPVR